MKTFNTKVLNNHHQKHGDSQQQNKTSHKNTQS